jgi:large subunit ribosomal protein L14e
MIAYGPDEGKLCVIVDVVEQTRALVDGPCSGVKRQAISFKWLALTSIVIKIAPSQRSGGIRKAWEKADVNGQWEKTAWAKRLADKERRRSMTDFDRFKLKIAKQMVSCNGLFLELNAISIIVFNMPYRNERL